VNIGFERGLEDSDSGSSEGDGEGSGESQEGSGKREEISYIVSRNM
jgi:hypothetical protein